MLESAVDSNKLLNVVEKVTDVVNMSARTRPPPLEPPAYMRDYDRDTSIGVSASSGSASTGVDHDSSGAEGMYHTPEPSYDGEISRSDGNLDLEAQSYTGKKEVLMAEQIRDLQQEFNELQLEAARKRLDKLYMLDRQSRPERVERG